MAACIWAQLILTVVVLQTLQLSNSAALAGSGQCERKVAILDKSGDYVYKFHFEACNDSASVCHLNTHSIGCKPETQCDSILGVGSITRAQFTDGICKGNIDYPKDDKSTFTVTLHRDSCTKTGVFNCTLSYQYTLECLDLGHQHQCPCSGQVNLDLTIEIDGLEIDNISLGHIVTGFVAFVIVLIVVIVLVMFVVSPAVQCGHKFYQRRRQAPRLIGQHIPHYGSVGSIDGRDLSRPVTPDPFADMDGVLVQGEAEGCDDLSEVETLLDERIPQLSQPSTSAAGRAKCKRTTKSPKVHEQQSTKSSSDEDLDPGITSDDQLVDLNLATEKDTPPSHRPVKYTCPYCEREYAEDRRHYYTRHIKERKCVPKTNGSAAISKSDKSDSTESESGSHTSSPINVFPMDSENSQEYP